MLPLLVRPQFLNAPNSSLYAHLVFIVCMNVSLFLINTQWLIPAVFVKYGALRYFLTLVPMVIGTTLLAGLLREWWLPDIFIESAPQVRFPLQVPVTFVTAISTAYGLIVHYSDQEKIRVAQSQEHLKSELSFLRSQISPHFIFNVLNSIVYLIRSQSDRAEAVTLRLSELMRYMLYEAGGRQIPLQRELDYVRNYVELQKMRFEEDVSVVWCIEGHPSQLMIEPMLLIPFIENAFKHGTSSITIPIITIDMAIKEEVLVCLVRNRTGHSDSKDATSGIGLKNVKRRLELLYPEQHKLTITESNEWFYVDLLLKLKNHA
jgi:two-component system, LytTR family, sensor kinase